MSKDLRKSIHGVAFLISQNFATRIITFIFNIVLARISSANLVGSLQTYELYYTTILFLSRGCFRMTLIRSSQYKDFQLSVNMTFIPYILFFSIVAFISCFLDLLNHKLYRLYTLAAGIEILSEPLYFYFQKNLLYSVRVRIEGFAIIFQYIITLLLCFNPINGILDLDSGIFAYAFGQIAYSLSILIGYVFSLCKNMNISSIINIFTPRIVYIKGELR